MSEYKPKKDDQQAVSDVAKPDAAAPIKQQGDKLQHAVDEAANRKKG